MTKDDCLKELLALEPVEYNADAVKRKTFARLGLATGAGRAAPAGGQSAPALRAAKGGRPRRGVLRVAAIAAALMLVLSTAVYAATVIYSMMQQDVDFFAPQPAASTPVDGPTYHGALAMDIEQYNAAVGQSVTDNGKTVTLDTVAVDDNFINAFFTIAYDSAIDLDAAVDGPYPAWHKLKRLAPNFVLMVDGQALEGGFSTADEYDPYMADGSTVKMMVRWVVPTQLPDVFTIALRGEEFDLATGDSSAITGRFDFELTVDKSASAAATRAAKPGQYKISLEGGDYTLDLNKLALTPFGGAFTVNGHWAGDELNPDPAYLMPEDFYITDDKGNVVQTFWNNVVASGSAHYALELLGAAPDARSITLTPIRDKTSYDDGEMRTYAVTDIGAKIPLSSLGGYTLEDYVVEGSRVSLVLRPYGRCNYFAGGFVLADDDVTLAEGRSGLANQQIDRKTGLLTYSVDYYAATPEELQSITAFNVWYEGVWELDEAAALTLPLAG